MSGWSSQRRKAPKASVNDVTVCEWLLERGRKENSGSIGPERHSKGQVFIEKSFFSLTESLDRVYKLTAGVWGVTLRHFWIPREEDVLREVNNRVGEMAHWLGAFVQSRESHCRDPAPKLGVLVLSPGLCVYTLTDVSVS